MTKAFTQRPSADVQAYIAGALDATKAEAPEVADKPKREKGKLITITFAAGFAGDSGQGGQVQKPGAVPATSS